MHGKHFILLNSEISALEITIFAKGSIDKRCGQPIDISIAGKEHPNKTTKKQHTNALSIRQEHLHAMQLNELPTKERQQRLAINYNSKGIFEKFNITAIVI